MGLGIRLGVMLGTATLAALAGEGSAGNSRVRFILQALDSTPSRCQPADTAADRLLDTLRRMATAATGNFAARRAALRLPTLSTTMEVQQVTKGERCGIAVRKADSVWARAKVSPHDAQRLVYLFMFGDYFVVADPKAGAGKALVLSSFSSAWLFLGTLRL